MIHIRNLLVPYLILGTCLTVLAEDKKQEAKPKTVTATPAPVPDPPKLQPQTVAAPVRAVRPVRPRSTPAAVRNEHARPRVDSAASRQLPVVWDRNWANPITVEWEDAPIRKPAMVEAKEPSPDVAEALVAIQKSLQELTQMIRAMAARQTGP